MNLVLTSIIVKSQGIDLFLSVAIMSTEAVLIQGVAQWFSPILLLNRHGGGPEVSVNAVGWHITTLSGAVKN